MESVIADVILLKHRGREEDAVHSMMEMTYAAEIWGSRDGDGHLRQLMAKRVSNFARSGTFRGNDTVIGI